MNAMPSKQPTFAERLQTAAESKKAQLKKISATSLANDAQSAERQAVRVETAEARKLRATERKDANRISAQHREAQRLADKARQAEAVAAENARKAEAVAAENARKAAERIAQAEADAVLKKDQKAARDSKYAARKARQS